MSKEYLIVMVLQVLFILIRFMNVRHIMGNSLKVRLFITLSANVVWLVTLSLGVKIMNNGEYIIIIYFMIGTVIGVLIEDKLRTYI